MTSSPPPQRRRRQPSGTALLFGILALAVPVVFGARLLNGDGDLPRHLVLGRYILGHGVVFADIFSHTLPGEPFRAYEWLSEVILWLTERVGGLAAVAVLAALLIATSIALVMRYLRPRVEPAVAVPVAFLAAVFTGPHWIARPHLFSFLCLSLLLGIVTRPPDWKRHLALGVLFALWANLHPGFFYGVAILGAYLLGDMLDHRRAARIRGDVLSGLVAVGATLLNPMGWGLHREILRHLGDTGALGLIQEFQPPSLRSGYGLLFFAVVSGVVVLLIARRRRPPWAVALPLAAAVVAGVTAQRNITLFGLFALPLAVSVAAEPLRRWRWAPVERARRTMEEDDARAVTAPWIVGAVLVLTGLVVTSGRLGPVQIVPDAFSRRAFPVEAVARAREAGLEDRRMFNAYLWGGYVLWAWPGERIYIDGMANFFGASLMAEYTSVMLAEPGWETALERRGIDMLLVPPAAPLARAAEQSGEWERWYADDTAVILLERPVVGAADGLSRPSPPSAGVPRPTSGGLLRAGAGTRSG